MKNISKISAQSWYLRMSEVFLIMLVFCIPFGTRLQWITAWSNYGGEFCEYLTYFIYLSDILTVLVLGFWLIDVMVKFWKYGDWDDWKINPWQALVVVVFFLLVFWAYYSILWSNVRPISWYKAFRLLSLFGLFSYFLLVIKNHLEKWKILIGVILISAIFQVGLGLWQYFYQHDVGWWWLGESVLSPMVDGVAKIDVGAQKFIRAYGTLPHANIYAFFLWTALVVLLIKLHKSIVNFSRSKTKNIVIQGIFLGLVGVGLLVSFSRVAWVASSIVLVGFVINYCLVHGLKIQKWLWLLVFGLFMFFAGLLNREALFVRTSADVVSDISYQTREIYESAADVMIEKHYYNGWGVGSFVFVMPYFASQSLESWMYQPVHNLYKLIWAELGVFGFLGISLLMLIVLVNILFNTGKWRYFWISVWLGLFFLQLFDHYMWDIWQGQLVFVLILAMVMTLSVCEFGRVKVKENLLK